MSNNEHPVFNGPAVKIYFAAPLFTILERRANRALAKMVEQYYPTATFMLPQDFKHKGRYNDSRAFGLIFKGCIQQLDQADVVLAWLDGPDSDSGTCFEVGYAFAKEIPVIGIRTDFRHNQEYGMNVMLSRSCTEIVYRPAFAEDIEGLARDIAKVLRKVARRLEK